MEQEDQVYAWPTRGPRIFDRITGDWGGGLGRPSIIALQEYDVHECRVLPATPAAARVPEACDGGSIRATRARLILQGRCASQPPALRARGCVRAAVVRACGDAQLVALHDELDAHCDAHGSRARHKFYNARA